MPLNDRSNRRLGRLGNIRLGYRAFKCKKCGLHVQWDGHERQRCPQCDTMRTGLIQDGHPSKSLFPKQADHFLLHDAHEIEEYYASKGVDVVRELDVILPFRELERNYDANYEVWAGRILVCQGDGSYVRYATPCEVRERNGEAHIYNAPGDTLVSRGTAQVPFDWNGEHFEPGDHVPCPGARGGAYPHCAACNISGILKVMMADPALFRFGYYQIASGSGNNHDVIMGTLETMNLPDYRGFPFTLRLVEGETTYLDENKMRRKTKKWFLQLEPRKQETRLLYRQSAARMLGAPEPSVPPALIEPPESGPDWDEYELPDGPPDDVSDGAPPTVEGEPVEEPPTAEAEPVEEPPAEAAPIQPAPDDLTRGNLEIYAIDLLGYESVGAVKNALLAIYGPTWERDDWDASGAWQQLQDHKQAA